MSNGGKVKLVGESGSSVYIFMVCIVAALGGLLFGYDTGVINGAIGPLKAHFTLDAKWEGWATGCALLGCAIGVAFAGVISDWLGRKKVLILAAILFFISAVGTALPRTITAFIIFRIIGGLGVGAASMSSPMYIAEITPARIRGRMVSVNQFAIVSGFLVVYFVNFLIGGYGDSIDRRLVNEHIAKHGQELNVQAITKFINWLGPNIDSEEVRSFLIEQG
jgi:MFS family permease